MTKRMYCAIIAGLMLCGIAQADTLEEAEKKIIAEAEKVKTMTAKMLTTSESEGSGMNMKLKMEGTTETAWRGEKMFMRAETKSSTVTKMSDQPENKSETKSLSVADGEFLYVLNEMDGNKTAMKMKLQPKMKQAAREAFETLHKEYELKLLDDDKHQGKAVYVIEAKPKKAEEGTTSTAKFFYTKDGGVMVKSETTTKSPQMKMHMVFELSDVKLNPDIKSDRFVFKAPDGVEVQDMTKLGAGEPQEDGTTTAKPADEPKEQPKTEAKEEKKEEKKSEPPKEEKKKPKLPRIPGLGR